MVRIAPIICILGAAACAAASVVYDNSANPTGEVHMLLDAGQTSSVEHGNEILLAGATRTVTNIRVFIQTLHPSVAAFDLRIRFYAIDGPGGPPGQMLWESSPQPRLIDFGVPIAYSVSVPNIVVPNRFIWTVQLTNRQGNPNGVIGPALFDPPVVGSAAAGFWHRTGPGPDDWQPGDSSEAPFGAVLTAEGNECASPPDGDLNFDDVTNGEDIRLFVQELLEGSEEIADLCAADFNFSGRIDAGDAPAFVNTLVGP